jgi:hypothetical protein
MYKSMRKSADSGRGMKGLKYGLLRGFMGAHVYIVCTVSLQETLYKNDSLGAEAGIDDVVAWCLALTIAFILFILPQHRKFDQGSVRGRLSLAFSYVSLSVALGIITGYVASPVFIRGQHFELWALYTLGTTALFLAFIAMIALDGKRSKLGGAEK